MVAVVELLPNTRGLQVAARCWNKNYFFWCISSFLVSSSSLVDKKIIADMFRNEELRNFHLSDNKNISNTVYCLSIVCSNSIIVSLTRPYEAMQT